jgi:hypothetical protein
MAVYILMNREREMEDAVTYRVTVNVPTNSHLTRSGKTRFKLEEKVGYFIYHKTSGEIFFLPKSNQYYLNNDFVLHRCLQKMNQCKEQNKFTEVVTWAS